MSFSFWPKAAVLALLPVAAIAQQGQATGPADANAPVPALGYVSAFTNYRILTDKPASPDALWRAANEEVGRNDPHVGHGAMPVMKAQPAAPQSSSVQPDPHGNHGVDHDMQGK